MEPTDQAAVAAATAGDEAAFSALVERHRHELQVHCYRMLGSLDDAEDQLQETFLRAWRRRATYAGRSTFRAWLYRIATNACLDELARRPRRPSGGEVPWLQPYPDELLEAVPAEAGDPDAAAVEKETIELAFMVAIQHLQPKARAALILRDVLGWSAKDAAALLETSVACDQQRAPARAGGHARAPARAPARVGARHRPDRGGARAARPLHRRHRARRPRRARRDDARRPAASRCRRSPACTTAATRSSASGSRAGSGPTRYRMRCARRPREPPAGGRVLRACAPETGALRADGRSTCCGSRAARIAEIITFDAHDVRPARAARAAL